MPEIRTRGAAGDIVLVEPVTALDGGGINPGSAALIAGGGVELGPNGALRFHRWIHTPTPYSVSWLVPLRILLVRVVE